MPASPRRSARTGQEGCAATGPFQIPPPAADFTGREQELADLCAAMATGGATISGLRGIGGVGKTALACVLADKLRAHCPDGQLLVPLAGASDHPLVPAHAMGVVIHSYQPELRLPDDLRELPNLYRSTLDGKRGLLLLDDARDAAQVRELLRLRAGAAW